MRKKPLLGVGVHVLLLVVAARVEAQPFPASNVTLRSWLPLSSFTPVPAAGSSCWGYVAPSGREYALMGLYNQMAVVEITNPSRPVIVGSVSHSGSDWCEVKAYSTYAYVTNESGGGLDIVNLANVDSGTVTLVQRLTVGGLSTSHTVTVNPDSGFLYLNGSNLNGGRLLALSLANPASPTIAGAWTEAGSAYVHDSEVVTYTSGPYAGREIAFCCDGGTGFDIVDVTNKAAMTRLSRSTYPHLSYCHQGWLSNDRQYFYINDETDGVNETVIFNVSNLSAPSLVSTYSSGLSATDHNQYIRGDFMFESDYDSGLRIFCLASNPLSPAQVGWFDTYPEDDGAGYNGAWNTFPYFPSGNVIISDINRGLFVVDPSAALTAGAVSFSYPNGRPQFINPGGGARIRVNIDGVCGAAVNAATPLLHYNAGNGYQTVALEAVSPGFFDAVFPAIACPTTISYYVSAESTQGTVFNDPPAAPGTVYNVISASGTIVTLSDDFEAATGWTVGDPSSPDAATTGIWNRQDPEPTGAQPGEDHTPGAGTICWVTDGRAGTNVGQYDVDGGKTTLMSPALNLSAQPEARIGYWRWYSNTAGSSPNADTFRVGISNNNGSTWTLAKTVGPTGPETSGGWFYHQFRVADFAAPTAQVKLRFVAEDVGAGSIIEAALDDFQIFTFDCTITCLKGDVNNDGVVDAQDIAAFTQTLLNNGPPATIAFCATDMDGDATLETADDVDAFVNCLLGLGCP